ncbi:MAG: beta-lactamase family protein, partial [Candidatus Eremiobacteraeota bacterium]|nr:beta-lactamase family protein [Candidatus Eremiobacteraeota bacterium]
MIRAGRLGLVLACAALLSASWLAIGNAEPALPRTPPGKALHAWLTAFNNADRAAMQRYFQMYAPGKRSMLDMFMDFRQQTGGFALKKIESATSSKIVALVQERQSDQMARLALEVANSEPHHVAHFTVLAIPRPPEFALPHLNQADLLSALRATLRESVAADHFAGAVLVAKGGAPIFAQAYGLADREHKIPNTLETRFRLGSMNKMFTAVSIMQLVQAGKVGLQDSLGKYLTDYPNKRIASQVTIHELLIHTGGTGDFFGPDFDKHRLQLRTLHDYITLFGKRGPQFRPGSRFEYSNYGFILLGSVVEKVSGQSYYDYVRDH